MAFRPVLRRALFYLSKQRKNGESFANRVKMYFKVHFETVIRGHHVYKHTWTPVIDQVLPSEKDNRAEAQEHDSNAVGVYLVTTQSDAKKTLAGHVPIELSHLLKFFLEAEAGI